MILNIIARNKTVVQTVITQQPWFKMVATSLKILDFVILADCFQIFKSASYWNKETQNKSYQIAWFFFQIIFMILWNHFSTAFWYKRYNLAGTYSACNL